MCVLCVLVVVVDLCVCLFEFGIVCVVFGVEYVEYV